MSRAKNTNKQLLNWIANRLDIGNVRFGKSIPLDGTYDLKDAMEEGVDLCIYVTSVMLDIHKATLFNKLAIDKIMEHYNFQSLDGKETVLTEEDFDKICETIKKSLHSEKCVDLY
tara:strand:- start:34 stop:378 length:345 start_codon:yes stop_codon:yes gene_type:complete